MQAWAGLRQPIRIELVRKLAWIVNPGIYSAKLRPICNKKRVPAMQRRQHPRVRLRLPARLRWSAPLGQRTDQCETVNVSKGGLLLACNEGHGVGHPLWVTIPYDAQAAGAQPETVARVVRCWPAGEERSLPWNVAMHFEGAAQARTRGKRRARQPCSVAYSVACVRAMWW